MDDLSKEKENLILDKPYEELGEVLIENLKKKNFPGFSDWRIKMGDDKEKILENLHSSSWLKLRVKHLLW